MIRHLITHSGSFHGDDVSAAAILTALHPDASLIRSRDEAMMDTLEGEAIIFDVGRVYDVDRRRFDHHMRGARTREDGVIYSSFGLIWDVYGRDYLRHLNVDAEFIESVHAKFDRDVVRPMDMIDTGSLSPAEIGEAGGISLAAMIATFNPAFDEQKTSDACFERAMSTVSVMFGARINAIEAELRAAKVVEHEVRAQWGEPILFLSHSVDFQQVLDDLGADHVKMAIQPSSSGGWGLTVARTSAQTYENLIDLPEDWAGLSGEELERVSGIEGLNFCHSAKFFAAATTKDALITAAQITLDQDKDFQPSI